MDIFTFEPSEFVVLEESVEVDEMIQREEGKRFYTLDEQSADAFEKMLPRTKRVTQFERIRIQSAIDNFKSLYDEYVVPTASDYLLREAKRGTSFPWIHPLLDEKPLSGTPFNFATLIETNTSAPNYYPRLIAKLPKPYASLFSSEGGMGVTFDRPTDIVVGDKRVVALPPFFTSRSVVHVDESITYEQFPFADSEDRVHVVGYQLDERKLPIPNPIDGHPFFTDNKQRVIYTTEPLVNVLPSIDAVLTHGVPVTSDPYGEAAPYLKLYDVQLSSIPWSAWKSRFPPANSLDVMPPRDSIAFPSRDRDAPGGNIVDLYQNSYNPGVAAREWLIRQADGGETVVRILQSLSLEHGTTGAGELGALPRYEPIRPEECGLLGLSFVDFANRGVMRRILSVEKGRTRAEDKDIINYVCVPIEFVRQERARTGYVDRLTWQEGVTDKELKETQLKSLRNYRFLEETGREEKYAVAESKGTSQKHTDVLAILNDPHRVVEDKLRDTHDIVKDAILSENIYRDEDGLFVLCKHTLAQLSGDAARDAKLFARTWGVEEDGFVICRSCGQRIDAVDLEAQAEFDGFDRLIIQARALDSSAKSDVVHQESALSRYKSMFIMDHAAHAMMFTLLTLLQVVPEAPMLDTFLKSLITFTGKDIVGVESKLQKGRCQTAVAMTALLLQSHIPFLVPQRAFGSRAFQLSGYPRDTDKVPGDDDYTTVDSLLYVLRATFESFPTSIPDIYLEFIRDVLVKPKDQRKRILAIMGELLKKAKFKEAIEPLLKTARDFRLHGPPVVDDITPLITIQKAPFKFGTRKSYVPCPGARAVLAGKQAPLIRQEVVPLDRGIQASSKRTELKKPVSVREIPKATTAAQVREMLKGSVSERVIQVSTDYRTNFLLVSTLCAYLKQPDPTRTVDYTQDPSLLRDLSQGMLMKLIRSTDAATLERARKSVVGAYMLTASLKEEEKKAKVIRARERNAYVKRMGELSDTQRQIALELERRGMAPVIITTADREYFAAQEEADEEDAEKEMIDRLNAEEEGPGAEGPQRDEDADDDDMPPLERDYGAERVGEGHDPPEGANFAEDGRDAEY